MTMESVQPWIASVGMLKSFATRLRSLEVSKAAESSSVGNVRVLRGATLVLDMTKET